MVKWFLSVLLYSWNGSKVWKCIAACGVPTCKMEELSIFLPFVFVRIKHLHISNYTPQFEELLRLVSLDCFYPFIRVQETRDRIGPLF